MSQEEKYTMLRRNTATNRGVVIKGKPFPKPKKPKKG
jgi:hypothetical protein